MKQKDNIHYYLDDNQLLELTDDWCIDFYKLMSRVFAKQSFFSIEENISMLDVKHF